MLNITQYEQLEKAYGKTLREIASDSDSWKRFLDSAGYTYRQSFKNQVAMYSQKPGMKAVLTEKRWEDMNRAVKSGTTGVRIFDDKSPNHISYVFDYADTVPGSPPPGPRPWTVHKNKTGIALHNLLKRTGEKNLDNYVQNRVRMIVDSEVDPGAEPAVRAALQRCLEQSAMYVTCVRLGLPTERLDTGAFSFPTRYRDNGKVIQRIGTLLNHTLRACLEPVRDVAYSMNMTMPAPEEIAAQAKQPEPSAAPALPDLAKVPVRRKGDTITIGRGETAHEIDVTVSDEDHAAIAAHLPNQAKQPVKHHTAQGKPDAGYEQLSLAATLSRNVRADLEDVARLHDGYVQRMENGGILSPAEAADMDDLEDIQGRLEKELQQDKTAQKIVQEAEAAAAPQKGAADYAVEIPVDGEWTKFQTVQEAEHAAYQEWIKEGRKNAVNYSTTGDREPSGGPKARFQDNIAALRLLQYLDADGQQASPEQQQVLARYVSWGGLSDAFDGKKAEWAGEYKTLKELLPAQEYEAARASTLTSFYTPPEIIRTMYETLERFGLKGGNILEPSMGVGAFFANRPASFDTNGTMLYGVELDPVTGRIAQQLFPKANIQITGYEKASLPDSFFDAVVGNVPFGQYKVNDPAFNRYNFLIHDYFAAKNIDKLRVGGIQAIITTSGTMDKKSEDVRRYLAARCDLIGAVRLPNTAFKAAAGTEVTADILFLQKRDGVLSNPEADWLHVGQTADGIPMNQYFIDHPEMICGKMEMVSGPYGPRPTCQPDTDTSLEEQLRTAMGRLQAVLPELAPLAIGDEENAASSKAIPADPAVRNYSYCVRDGKIYFRRDSLMWEQTPNAMTRQRIEGMVGLLSATRELIQAQVNDLPEEEIARLQRQLSRQYDDYVSKYGRLYSRANNAAFHEDSGYSLLRSLERVDEEGNFAGKADMFTKRTIRPTRVIDHVDTAAEALVVSLAEHGGIDLRDEIEQFTEVINAAKKERTGQELTVKQLERAKKSLESRLEKLMDAPKDDAVTFEELGVDSLMVDEAHQFKNLAVQTKMQNVSGITTAESRKATDLLMKCQYLDEITGGKGVVFCTGTPISNSAAELYTMMRYIQADTLREHGLYAFDAWAANFGETVSAMELAPEGTGYRMKTRFARFNNLPELISMWKLAADVQTADMLKLEVPELEGGKPTVIMCPPTELQKHTIQALGERAEAVRAGSVDPHMDNMLKITTDGRKLALDQRLLNPALPDDPGSKANACADKVYEIWAQTRERRSTQLIFSDLATPGTGAWNVYDDIRDKLIARGVPKEEIAYIHDANTDAKKAALFARVRAGKVRVLLGSTQKMGAGTNVQTKLIALHHLDVPWRPSDIEQREGRILRQGNENKRVQIFRYATEGSFDAYSWQLIENKQRYISQIMTSKTPARSCEDLDEATLTYAEVKALCAGNPLIKEKMDLDNEVARLSTLRSAHNAQIYELQDLVSIGYPAAIRRIGQELDALRQDAALFQSSLRKDDKGNEMFSAVIQGVTYTKRADADAALLEACKAAAAGAGEKKIGRYCGFDICVGYDPKIIGFAGYLQGEQRYRIELNPKQNFSSFRAVLENISAQIPVKIAAREEIEKNIESAKEAAKQPFAYEEEFQTKLARLNELNILLDQEKQELVQNEKENRMQKENVNLHAEENEDWEASTVEPAAKLPAGWKWTMYSDGSGRLEGPDKQSLYSYDRMTYASAGEIEYRKSNNSSWDVFPEGSLDRFREWAEQQLLQELKKEPLQYQEFLEHQSHQDDEIEKNPLDMEDAARQAGLTVQRDQDKPGAAYFDADQNVIHVSDAGSEEDVRLSELKGYADAVIQRTATVEQPVRDLESASLAVMLAARYDVGVSDRLSQQLASAHAEAVKCPTFDLPVTLQRLDKALDYCDHFLAHEQERALEQEAENEPEPEQVTELSPQSQAFMMDL